MMPSVIHDTAADATRLGLVVLPVREDGSKRPDLPAWKPYTERRPTREELRTWFPSTTERTGIGMVMGAVSGNAECLDFDDNTTYEAFWALCREAGLGALLERVLTTYCETTPNGVHLVYRCPDWVEGNQKLARRRLEDGGIKALIETRGEGGYIVCAPSHGAVHESGRPYARRSGPLSAIAELTGEERSALLDLARTLDEMPRQAERSSAPQVLRRSSAAPQVLRRSSAAAPRGGSVPAVGDERPGDQFSAQARWSELLEPHGWTWLFRHGALDYWRRPGKAHGVSATTGPRGADQADYLYVFSTSTEFDPERGYSKFGAYGLLEHRGDYAEAARELRRRGYGGDGSGVVMVAGGGAPEDAAGVWAGETSPEPPAIITTPEPLAERPYCFDHVFPEGHFVRRYIEYASQRTDAPWEYHEALAVALLGAVTPGIRTRLAPWPAGLPTNLYVVLVGDSSRSRKSTAIGIAKQLLDETDDRARFPDRFSPEAMLEQLSYRSNKPAVWFPDELGKVLEDIERKPQLEDALLTLYDGPQSYTYARHTKRVKGGDTVEDYDRIEHPHWNIMGATTEAVFDGISSRIVQSGLLPRFAYVYPQQRPPRMGLRVTTPGMEAEQAQLRAYLREISTWAMVTNGAVMVEIEPESIELLDAYQAEVEALEQTITARLAATAVKLAMLAALGAGVPRVTRLVVQPEDAARGVALARRWQASALRFNAEIGGFDPVERRFQQRIDKALLYLRQTGRRSREEMIRYLRVRAKELDELQDTLVTMGRILIERGESSGGRPPTFWRLA